MSATQPGLFDEAVHSREHVFFATNRHNLLRLMAARMLMPLSGFAQKHYGDLLEVCPGRIPLLAASVAGSFADRVTREVPDIPVLLEIRSDSLTATDVPSLLRDGRRAVGPVGSAQAVAWAGGGCVGMTPIEAIHTASEADRNEIEARAFDDVPDFSGMLRVSPSLFEGRALKPDVESVVAWLGSLEPIPRPAVSEIDIEDRRGGALLLGAMAARDPLVLGGLAGALRGADVDEFARRMMAWEGPAGRRRGDAEAILLGIAMEVLGKVDRSVSWRPSSLLQEIAGLCRARLPRKAVPAVEEVLARTGSIIRNDVEFEGFRPSGSPTLKAALLVLLRPDPATLLADPILQSADLDVRTLAGAFAGLMTGRSRLSVALRPPALDDALASLAASRLQADREAIGLAALQVRAEVELEPRGRGNAWVLRIDGTEVISVPAPATSSQTSFDAHALERDEVRARALLLAEKRGWLDCLVTTVEGDASSVTFEALSGRYRVRSVGETTITTSLDDAAFLSRIESGDVSGEENAKLVSPAPNPEPATSTPPPRNRRVRRKTPA